MSVSGRLRSVSRAAVLSVMLGSIAAVAAAETTPAPSAPPLPSALRFGLSVLPIRLEVGADAPTGVITVVNGTADAVQFQVTGFAWDESVTGTPILNPSSDLVFYPTIFSLPAEGTQVIRVGVLGAPSPAERTFRVYVEQLPSPQVRGRAQTAGLALRTRFGIPLFVQPENAAPRLELDDATLRKKQLSFRTRNVGNGHDLVASIDAEGLSADGVATFRVRGAGWYVLAGRERIFVLSVPKGACDGTRALKLVLQDESGVLTQTLPVERSCE